jgi:ribonuclease P protein component
MVSACACVPARGVPFFVVGAARVGNASASERISLAGEFAVSEKLSAEEKIRRRAEYQRCYRKGRRRHGTYTTVHFVPNTLGHPRLGITATRKIGPAVVRNKLKRRAREIYRRWERRPELPALDIVVHFKPPAREASFEALETELLRQCRSLIEKSGRAR